MKVIDQFRQPALARALAAKIQKYSGPPLNVMEVCGTHTVAIFRHGIKGLLPPNIKMLSGPGCPVCVTPNIDIDRAIALAGQPGVILTTFGDMMRVPGSYLSLGEVKAKGADVRVVYSPLEVLDIANDNPTQTVVFLGVGFETTAPTTAVAILEAQRRRINNYFFLSFHKLVPPALRTLLQGGEINIDALICPGHVSTIIGSKPYEFIAKNYGIPCVITGFEPVDILQAIDMLIEMHSGSRAEVAIQYNRAVHRDGNPQALSTMARVFELDDATWRGLGNILGSGLKLLPEFDRFDAMQQLKVRMRPPREMAACRCGEVLRGVYTPQECRLFGLACTPEHPVGPCMVSSEGTCSAWFLYRSVENAYGTSE